MAYGIVYEVLCIKTGLRYVGQTVQTLAARWRGHVLSAQKGTDWEFPRAIREFGIENFEKHIICECESQIELNEAEKKWISELNVIWPNGYNMRNGAQYTHETTRHLMSIAKKGKPLSEKHKQKLSEANMGHQGHWLGKQHSEATKQKMSESHRGKFKPPRTEAHCKAMSEAKKGKPTWNKGMIEMPLETRKKLNATLDEKHVIVLDFARERLTLSTIVERTNQPRGKLREIIKRAFERGSLNFLPNDMRQ